MSYGYATTSFITIRALTPSMSFLISLFFKEDLKNKVVLLESATAAFLAIVWFWIFLSL